MPFQYKYIYFKSIRQKILICQANYSAIIWLPSRISPHLLNMASEKRVSVGVCSIVMINTCQCVKCLSLQIVESWCLPIGTELQGELKVTANTHQNPATFHLRTHQWVTATHQLTSNQVVQEEFTDFYHPVMWPQSVGCILWCSCTP